jgi:hypothetical protein
MLRLRKLLTLSAVLLGACGDDVDTVHNNTPPADALSDTASEADISPEDAAELADAAPDGDSGPADTGPDLPEVLYGEPLPVAADFDPTYVGLGDLVATTLTETLRPRYGFEGYLDDEGRLRVPLEEVGRLRPQPGEPHVLRDQLALPEAAKTELATWTVGTLPESTRSYLYAFILSDPQLVDADSPAQVAKNAAFTFSGFALPAYRPHGEFAPLLVDSLIRTANRFATPRPFDAAFISGDLAENGQKNELSWLHTLLVGGEVLPDSGRRDDVVPGPANDAFDPFLAEGLDPRVPWVSVIGNHDILINGNFPPRLIAALYADPSLLDALEALIEPFGLTIPGAPLAATHPAWFPHAERTAFRVDPQAFHPSQPTTDAELMALTPAAAEADPDRAPFGVCEFIDAHRRLPGLPEGHGFSAADAADCRGWSTWDPVPGLALRIVSLMLGPNEGGPSGILSRPAKDGTLDLDRFGDPRFDQVAFLEAELARAEAEGTALIIVSHQRSGDLATSSFLRALLPLLSDSPELVALLERESPEPIDPVSTTAFRQLLAASGHVIAHLSGHTHDNGILAICANGEALGPDDGRCDPGLAGETGYWELTTSGAISFPHEGRILEVVRDAGRLAGLYLTMVEPRIPAASFALDGRFVSLVGEQLTPRVWSGAVTARLERNVFLPVALPEAVATRWDNHAAFDALASETTLRETRPALPPLPVRP